MSRTSLSPRATNGHAAVVVCLLLLVGLSGCGDQAGGDRAQVASSEGVSRATHDPENQAQSSARGSAGGNSAVESRPALPTVSIASATGDARPNATASRFEPGSPEWLIREIVRLRVRSAPPTDEPQRLRAYRRWRNEKIIQLAQEAVAQTHDQPQREQEFNEAIHHLMEARLELALQVGAEQQESAQAHIAELYSDADALYRRDPGSKAAAEAAFARAKFANACAERFADRDQRWLEEFSRQSRLFADNFPQERSRAAMLLDAAGRSCDLHRLRDEAINCYTVLANDFARTPQGRQAVAVLRRLRLDGRRLEEFGGPTLDGGYVRVEDFRGQIVIVAFWAWHSRESVEHLPRLVALRQKVGDSKLAVVGVSLDRERRTVETFQNGTKLPGPTILWPDADRREWNNPIVEYYGVRDIPLFWLIDEEGVVVDSNVDPDTIGERVETLSGGN